MHPAHVFTTLQGLLAHCAYPVGSKEHARSVRYWTRVWNKHVQKHGNTPFVQKCAVCSGQEHKTDIRHGKFKVSTRTDQREKRAQND